MRLVKNCNLIGIYSFIIYYIIKYQMYIEQAICTQAE